LHDLTLEEKGTLIDAVSDVDDLPSVDLVTGALCALTKDDDGQDGANRLVGPRMGF